MENELQMLLNQLKNNLNKEIIKECLEKYNCFLCDNNYPVKTLELEELWDLLHSENKNTKSIYLVKKDFQIPFKLYCDEVKVETIQEDNNVVFRCTMPYWWSNCKFDISGMA
jgi:hypothetical protein